jgi:integrase
MAKKTAEVKSVDTADRQVVTVKLGNLSVRILPTLKSGREYWLVEDYSQGRGRRRLLNAKNLSAARARAKQVLLALQTGEQTALDYDSQDLLGLRRSEELVMPHGRCVDEVAREWTAAMDLLKGRGSVMEAVRFFLDHGGAELKPRTVQEAADELMALKKAQNMSDAHLESLKARFNRVKTTFGARELHSLTVAEIENFILGLNMSAKSQNHYREMMGNLFVFAQSRAYVPKDFNPAKEIRRAKVDDKEVQHYTVEQMNKLIAACTGKLEDHLPLVLLCGFAGLRPSEAGRVTWQMIGEDFIRLPGNVTKTGKARLVPISGNLKLWLAPLRQKAGLVVTVDVHTAPGKLTAASGVAWIDDGLRHSYGTFRQAVIKNIGEVSEEMGNTIRICRKHYVNPMVTKAEGEAWFAIKPEGMEKVTTMPQQAIG